jgi:hypothetical protein
LKQSTQSARLQSRHDKVVQFIILLSQRQSWHGVERILPIRRVHPPLVSRSPFVVSFVSFLPLWRWRLARALAPVPARLHRLFHKPKRISASSGVTASVGSSCAVAALAAADPKSDDALALTAAAAAGAEAATTDGTRVMCVDRMWMILDGTRSSVTGHSRLSFAFVPIVPYSTAKAPGS